MAFFIPALIQSVVAIGTAVAANRRQKKATEAQQRQADSQALLERRRQIREDRVRRAQVIAQSQAQGTAGSSSEASATGSITGQTQFNLSQSKAVQRQSNIASSNLQAAQNIRDIGAGIQTIFSV